MSISEGTGLLISSPLPILRTTCKVTVCRRLMTPALGSRSTSGGGIHALGQIDDISVKVNSEIIFS